MSIQVLDTSLINKIAAGEVVERPASVVKELCENAMDAGGRSITVEISDGGLSLIRVSDDGAGIPAEQTETAFLRHATSKLADEEGLTSIRTMGFRGEALSSIAAVSMTEMVTKTAEAETAAKIIVHGGVIQSADETAAPQGTSITVRDLFYNTPARRKFLKKPGTEGGYAAETVQRLALARPDIAFTFINNGAEVFRTSGGGSPRNAFLGVLGRETASKLLDVSYERGFFRVHGLTGKPELSRGNRSHSFFFINKRYIKNHIMQSAAEAAYKGSLTSGKFPVYALYVDMPPDLVDVNVHPAKLEVRFSRDVDIFKLILGAVEEALGKRGFIPVVALPGGKSGQNPRISFDIPAPPEPISPKTKYDIESLAKNTNDSADKYFVAEERAQYKTSGIMDLLPDITYINTSLEPPAQEAVRPPLKNLQANFLKQGSSALLDISTDIKTDTAADIPEGFKPGEYRIAGQIFFTYWIIELNNGSACYLMDQHAAHERVLYEEIRGRLNACGVLSQRTVAPIPVGLSPGERRIVDENMSLFINLGFEFEDMYGGGIAIRAVPYIFEQPADGGFFMGLVDKLMDGGVIGRAYEEKLDSVSRMACRAAVKANDRLSLAEAKALVEKALALPLTCPHGRPIMVELSRRDIEKMFKRIQ